MSPNSNFYPKSRGVSCFGGTNWNLTGTQVSRLLRGIQLRLMRRPVRIRRFEGMDNELHARIGRVVKPLKRQADYEEIDHLYFRIRLE